MPVSEDAQGKMILYGAKKLTEFKEKLKVYEAIRKKNTERMRTREKNSMQKKTEEARKLTTPKNDEKEQETDVRCYNCDSKGHKTKDCKKKELGKKCFKCQKYGHTAKLCNASDDSEVIADKKTAVINTVIDSSSERMLECLNKS